MDMCINCDNCDFSTLGCCCIVFGGTYEENKEECEFYESK